MLENATSTKILCAGSYMFYRPSDSAFEVDILVSFVLTSLLMFYGGVKHVTLIWSKM